MDYHFKEDMFLLLAFLAGCPKEASENPEVPEVPASSCHIKKIQELELTTGAISCQPEFASPWTYCISYPMELQGRQFRTGSHGDRCYILTP